MRGNGRVFKRGSMWWIAYSHRGKELRESAAEVIQRATRKGGAVAEEEAHKIAEKFLKRRLQEVGADALGARTFVGPAQQRITVGDLLDAVGADFRLRGVKSLPQILSHVKPIREAFGDWRAVDVSTEAVDRFVQAGIEQGKAPASINRGTQLLAQAFRLAVERGRLSTAPRIRRLTERNARQGFFEQSDFDAVVSLLPDYLQDFARFGYFSGWRKGEIASLLWSDVDMGGRVIRLRPDVAKNGQGRSLGLEEELLQIMARRTAQQIYRKPGGTVAFSLYVFHCEGEPIGDFRKAWATACKQAGLWEGDDKTGNPTKLFHDLRRTACRNMIRAGVPERVAMEVSGHKTRSMFDRYNITSEKDLREAMHKTQEYLKAAESERNVIALSK